MGEWSSWTFLLRVNCPPRALTSPCPIATSWPPLPCLSSGPCMPQPGSRPQPLASALPTPTCSAYCGQGGPPDPARNLSRLLRTHPSLWHQSQGCNLAKPALPTYAFHLVSGRETWHLCAMAASLTTMPRGWKWWPLQPQGGQQAARQRRKQRGNCSGTGRPQCASWETRALGCLAC